VIPIVSNGILIWVFQFMVSEKLNSEKEFEKLRQEIFSEYLSKIQCAITSMRNLYTAQGEAKANEAESRAELDNAVQSLRANVREIYYYFEDYKVVLGTNAYVASQHRVLQERFENWVINWEDSDTFMDFIHACEDMLHNIMDATLHRIYGSRRKRNANN
ncbi:MAG: hypothetical protein ABF515_07825, partial [Bifidobacterium sp.]